MSTEEDAEIVVERSNSGVSADKIIDELGVDKQAWHRISARAYAINIQNAKKKREEDLRKPNISAASVDEIQEIMDLNHKLSDYALCIPTIATHNDIRSIKNLLSRMPISEKPLLMLIEDMTLQPRIRCLQNVGRLQKFDVFKTFSKIIESATLCYYRANYCSAYLTLVPVIEGVLLRWLGYEGVGEKPDFEELGKFFDNAHSRMPCPGNPLFHEVYCQICSKLLKMHLYKPSTSGSAYSHFNRHQASHLLGDVEFATRENCIRLFVLLDAMAEIYLYETCCQDPRWSLRNEEIDKEMKIYTGLLSERRNQNNAEQSLLF